MGDKSPAVSPCPRRLRFREHLSLMDLLQRLPVELQRAYKLLAESAPNLPRPEQNSDRMLHILGYSAYHSPEPSLKPPILFCVQQNRFTESVRQKHQHSALIVGKSSNSKTNMNCSYNHLQGNKCCLFPDTLSPSDDQLQQSQPSFQEKRTKK